jgi:hypothetical protein
MGALPRLLRPPHPSGSHPVTMWLITFAAALLFLPMLHPRTHGETGDGCSTTPVGNRERPDHGTCDARAASAREPTASSAQQIQRGLRADASLSGVRRGGLLCDLLGERLDQL